MMTIVPHVLRCKAVMVLRRRMECAMKNVKIGIVVSKT